jgi:hypothetical protein
MEKDPAQRCASAEEVAYRLQSITPTIEIRNPKRAAGETPARGLPLRTQPVTARQRSSSEVDVPAAMPHWLPTAIAVTFVLSLLVNMQMLSRYTAARGWESSYITALDNSNPVIRANAAVELGKSSSVSSRGIAAVAEKLKDTDSSVRVAAAAGLGSAGRAAKSYVPALIRVQKEDADPSSRTAAAAAVKSINEAPLVAGFGGFLKFLVLLAGLSGITFVWYRDSEFVRGLQSKAMKALARGR